MVGVIHIVGEAEEAALGEEVWYEGFDKRDDDGVVYNEFGLWGGGLCGGSERGGRGWCCITII